MDNIHLISGTFCSNLREFDDPPDFPLKFLEQISVAKAVSDWTKT
jgi:hypothetical protein